MLIGFRTFLETVTFLAIEKQIFIQMFLEKYLKTYPNFHSGNRSCFVKKRAILLENLFLSKSRAFLCYSNLRWNIKYPEKWEHWMTACFQHASWMLTKSSFARHLWITNFRRFCSSNSKTRNGKNLRILHYTFSFQTMLLTLNTNLRSIQWVKLQMKRWDSWCEKKLREI